MLAQPRSSKVSVGVESLNEAPKGEPWAGEDRCQEFADLREGCRPLISSEAHKRFVERCSTSRQLDWDAARQEPAGTRSSLDLGAREHIDPEEGLRRAESVDTVAGHVEERYHIMRKLGQGSYGQVMEVTKRGDKKQRFAIKTIPVKTLKDTGRFEKELAVARVLKHPHIIRLHESFRQGEEYHLVMEFSSGGDLFEKVRKSVRRRDGHMVTGINSTQVVKYAWQMLTGIAYLHHYSFCHRDVKPENYLLNAAGDQLKLIDFGLARSFTRGEKMTTRVGTPQYVAPEVVNKKVHGYGAKCDVWSIGVTLWFASVGELPFVGATQKDVLKQVVMGSLKFKPQLWKELHRHPQELQDLIAELLIREPEERPSAKITVARNAWLIQQGDPQGEKKSCCSIS